MTRLPVVFLSHESPFLWDTVSPAQSFIKALGGKLPRPKSILVISAHWQESLFKVSTSAHPKTIHDFGGFPPHYSKVQYPAPGAPEVAESVLEVLKAKQIDCAEDAHRGMDHAVWLPIGLMYPLADVPVVSLSIKITGTPREHYELGSALGDLREQGVLIIGSGTATHNLRPFFESPRPNLGDPPNAEAKAFSQWLKENADNPSQILKYRRVAPHAELCHPSPDHFYPFIAALGAGQGDLSRCIHDSFNYSHFAMTSFAWGLGNQP